MCTVIHVLTQTEASAREQKPPWRGACFRALRQQRPVRGGGVPRNKKHWSTFVFEMMTFLREWPRPISYLHLTPPVRRKLYIHFVSPPPHKYPLCSLSKLASSTSTFPPQHTPTHLSGTSLALSSSSVLTPVPIHPAYSQGDLRKKLKMSCSFKKRTAKLARPNRPKTEAREATET